MHFISQPFLIFCLAFCSVYFWLGLQGQKLFLILASYFFVSYVSPWMALLLALSTAANYLASLTFTANTERAEGFFVTGIAFNVIMLGIFKYFDFFSTSIHSALSSIGLSYSPFTLQLAAPLGLSFYTFQAISYLIDTRKGAITPPSPLDFIVFMSFWPKFVAGPIIRAKWMLPQLGYRKRFKWPNVFLGTEMIVFGLFLKVVLSDTLLPQVNKVFANPAAFDGANSLMAVLFFTFQIYGDFAGYSLMVIGIARVLGFSVRQNFRRPNFAISFSDFWSRWHISLSSWLDDYVFRSLIPKARPGSGAGWGSVSALYADILRVGPTALDESFASLSGDSLNYVQIAIALEDILGSLPAQWERMTIRELDALRKVRGEGTALA